MENYKVYRSDAFKEEFTKYDKSLQDRVDKIETKLMSNPHYEHPWG